MPPLEEIDCCSENRLGRPRSVELEQYRKINKNGVMAPKTLEELKMLKKGEVIQTICIVLLYLTDLFSATMFLICSNTMFIRL